jgi:ABC-type bacteriocin/lantibiotic exporter with double-glycine peptidase domain
MPLGLDTLVTEGGSQLSGGQRQRVMIARALVSRPRLIFFDQATSALDNRTQAIVGESLAAMNATRIIIAHRLSTIRSADRIVVLENGRIAETGTYDELVGHEGAFRRLVQRQLL